MDRLLTIIPALLLALTALQMYRDVKRLEKENARLRGITKALRKQVSDMVERPF